MRILLADLYVGSSFFYDNQRGFWEQMPDKGLYYYHPELPSANYDLIPDGFKTTCESGDLKILLVSGDFIAQPFVQISNF